MNMDFFKNKGRLLLKNEQGNIAVLFAVSMILLLGVVGLVVDVGIVYKEKSDLKKIASTAALSGSQELTNSDPARVKNVVNTILSSYQATSSLKDVQINMNQNVRVTLQKKVPLVFAKIFGFTKMTVTQSSTASLFPITGLAKGATPLGVPDTLVLNYGQLMPLKLGAGDASGNFGILALEGTGASTYEETLKYGSKLPLSIGDIVNTQTGNIVGATQNGVNYRISQCPNPSGDMTIRECARILPVVVYQAISKSQIKVKGFAYFYLQQMKDNDTIMGAFIKRIDTGNYGTGSIDRGAYMTRLTE